MAKYTVVADVSMEIIQRLRREITPEPVKNQDLVAMCSYNDLGDLSLGLILYDIQFMDRSLYREYTKALPICLRYVMVSNSNAVLEAKAIEEQRILARAVQILNNYPIIRNEGNFLGSVDLPVSIVLENMSIEDKLKIWNNTSGTFRTSVFCSASPLFIDAAESGVATRVMKG